MDVNEVKTRMEATMSALREDIRSIRTGRATSGLVEDIEVEAYGGAQRMRIRELASINTHDPQSLTIEPWDKSIVGDIRKGILTANVGLNPNVDGDVIRIIIPPMTTEDRERYTKLLWGKVESGRVMVRQIRADTMKDIKNKFENKEISEDVRDKMEKDLQRIVDEYILKMDELGKAREQELMQV